MSSSGQKVLLICPPWREPNSSSVSVGTLRPILEADGIAVDELHGATLFPYPSCKLTFMETHSAPMFVPTLYPDVSPDRVIDELLSDYYREMNLDGARYPPGSAGAATLGIPEAKLRRDILDDIERARVCIDRIVERAARPEYDVVGFSVTFDAQVPAALCIARRLKAANPGVKLMMGGAACLEEQGDGLAVSFRELDVVCHTEGEAVIAPLVRALRGERPLAEVPGVSFVDSAGELHHTASPPVLADLDRLPLPNYDEFIRQLEQSEWRVAPPKLFFETSRGCWWGQKHLCSVCGLNAEGLGFRRKSPERAFQEIRYLRERYPSTGILQATDNILDMGYFKTVLPRLAEARERRDMRLFFEIKSNLRKDQVQVLADAGVTDVQPGIESFSDGVLANMDKGATGLGQLQFLKWAYESGINPVYNLIIRNPGDQAGWYEEMTRLVASIDHLPPPTGLTPMLLERFSPYHTRPERYGIENVRPKPRYRALYREAGVDLGRIAYQFDFDHPSLEDEALMTAMRGFVHRTIYWQSNWKPGRVSYVDQGDALVVADRRYGTLRTTGLSGRAADLFRYLDQARPLPAIQREFADLLPEVVESLLDTWAHRRWVCRDGDRTLCVVPRSVPQ